MPEPPCCRIVKFKETESMCSSIKLTVILDPRSSNTKSATLNGLNSTCQEQNMQEVAKKGVKKTERKFAQRNGGSTDLEEEKRIEERKSWQSVRRFVATSEGERAGYTHTHYIHERIASVAMAANMAGRAFSLIPRGRAAGRRSRNQAGGRKLACCRMGAATAPRRRLRKDWSRWREMPAGGWRQLRDPATWIGPSLNHPLPRPPHPSLFHLSRPLPHASHLPHHSPYLFPPFRQNKKPFNSSRIGSPIEGSGHLLLLLPTRILEPRPHHACTYSNTVVHWWLRQCSSCFWRGVWRRSRNVRLSKTSYL